jgi:HEAT repeat protein
LTLPTGASDVDETTNENVATLLAVTEALRAFAKALRANQLYLPNSPTRQRATELAQSRFAAVWEHADTMVLSIRETEMLVGEHVVYRDTERGADALPFLLHRDGLRELRFTPGFELEELPLFLSLLQKSKGASVDEDDLVTMLWVADFTSLHSRHVEVGTQVDLPLMIAGGQGIATFTTTGMQLATPSAESPVPGEGPPAGIVRIEDFDSTLYFLEPAELAYLNDEVRRAYELDGKRDVISILLDVAEVQTVPGVDGEVVTILESMLIDLIASASYEDVAHLLREARAATQRPSALGEESKRGLRALSTRLSDPLVMAQLLQALDESTRVPAVETLELLFAELQPSAMPPLFAWLTLTPASSVRAAVERAVITLASTNTSELVRLLDDSDANVVRGALAIAARLKAVAAIPALGKLLRSNDAPLRTDAVIALGEIASTGAMLTVERAIEDADRETRVAAFRAIANNRYTNALPRLAQAIRRKELRRSDLTEKVAVFEAYGLLCGEEGVSTLDAILNGKSILSYREPAELRACAARALGLVGSSSALASLQRSVDTKEPVVRMAVQRAFRANA